MRWHSASDHEREGEATLVALMARDPDAAMAQAALVAHLDQCGGTAAR